MLVHQDMSPAQIRADDEYSSNKVFAYRKIRCEMKKVRSISAMNPLYSFSFIEQHHLAGL